MPFFKKKEEKKRKEKRRLRLEIGNVRDPSCSYLMSSAADNQV